MSTPLIILAAFGDMHTNSRVALMPPSVRLDDGDTVKASPLQRFIWRHWLFYWSRVQAIKERWPGVPVWGVCLGELADDNYHKTSQLVTMNPADQLKIALEVMDRPRAMLDELVVLRGTEAHVGLSGHMDETIARELGALQHGDNSSTHHWIADFGGWTLDAAHHPGTGHARPWTRGGDANRLAAMVKDDYIENDMLPPRLVLRGHNHKPSDSADNHMTRAVILPSWQLTNAYGYRLGSIMPLPIGGAIVTVYDRKTPADVEKVYSRWPVKQEVFRWSSPKAI